MTIKYLVISAGAYRGINFIGAISHLFEQGFLNRTDIKEIHGVSIGAMVGLMLLMKNNWKEIDEYFIKRPWEKTLDKLYGETLLTDLYDEKGLFDDKIIRIMIENVLKSNNLSIDVTLKELYEYSNIDFHIYSTRLNDFKLIDFNHITHPNLKLTDAIFMSSCLPIIFKPYYYQDSYYIDGGFVNFYPVKVCLDRIGHDKKDEILSLIINDDLKVTNKNDSIFTYVFDIFTKIKNECDKGHESIGLIDNEIAIDSKQLNMENLISIFNNLEYRQRQFDYGVECAKKFLETKSTNESTNESTKESTKEAINESLEKRIDKDLQNSM